jgi:hypothetical protein
MRISFCNIVINYSTASRPACRQGSDLLTEAASGTGLTGLATRQPLSVTPFRQTLISSGKRHEPANSEIPAQKTYPQVQLSLLKVRAELRRDSQLVAMSPGGSNRRAWRRRVAPVT